MFTICISIKHTYDLDFDQSKSHLFAFNFFLLDVVVVELQITYMNISDHCR